MLRSRLEKYSKWFQLLNRWLGLIVTVGIVGVIFTIFSNNPLAYVVDFIATAYIILYLLNYLIESVSHYIKPKSN